MLRDNLLALGTLALLALFAPLSPVASPQPEVQPVQQSEKKLDKDLGNAAYSKDAYSKALAELARVDSAAAAHPDSLEPRLQRLRLLWALAVKEEDFMHRGLREIAALRRGPESARPREEILQVYEGAFFALGGKHVLWPPRKLEYMERAFPLLDAAVAANPDDAEIRYVRLMSCYYLPFFFKRKESVRDDFAALTRLLPEARGKCPAAWFAGVVRFVLDKGKVPPDLRAPLEAAESAARSEA